MIESSIHHNYVTLCDLAMWWFCLFFSTNDRQDYEYRPTMTKAIALTWTYSVSHLMMICSFSTLRAFFFNDICNLKTIALKLGLMSHETSQIINMFIVVSRSSRPTIIQFTVHYVHIFSSDSCYFYEQHFLLLSIVWLQPMSDKHTDKHWCDKNRRENETFYGIESMLVSRCTNPNPFVAEWKRQNETIIWLPLLLAMPNTRQTSKFRMREQKNSNISMVDGRKAKSDGISNDVTLVYAFERVAN